MRKESRYDSIYESTERRKKIRENASAKEQQFTLGRMALETLGEEQSTESLLVHQSPALMYLCTKKYTNSEVSLQEYILQTMNLSCSEEMHLHLLFAILKFSNCFFPSLFSMRL